MDHGGERGNLLPTVALALAADGGVDAGRMLVATGPERLNWPRRSPAIVSWTITTLVAWVNAETGPVADLALLAQRLGLGGADEDPEVLVAALRGWLEQAGRAWHAASSRFPRSRGI